MPFPPSRSVSFLTKSALLALASSALMITAGCGMGAPAAATPAGPAALGSVSGKAMGGPVPITGASVQIYETASTGVAHTALAGGYYAPSSDLSPLETATTDANGFFKFASTATCANSNDDVYITLTGGNGAGTAGNQATNGGNNGSLLLVAALGPCTSIPQFIVINEVTTVAAAYALAPFIYVNPTSGVVNITADSANYAATSGAAGTIYNPVGLQHAFLTATNLVNVATGLANTTLTQYTGSVLPYGVINSVANVLQACTNSNGSSPQLIFSGQGNSALSANVLSSSDAISGTLGISVAGNTAVSYGPYSSVPFSTLATDINSATGTTGTSAVIVGSNLTITSTSGVLTIVSANPTYYPNASNITIVPAASTETSCGQVLAAALPLNSSSVPANTFQAALNVATNPYMGGAGKAATFLGFQTGIGSAPYTPKLTPAGSGLTAVPADLSAGIYYPAAAASLSVATATTMDANDTLYIANELSGTHPPYFSYSIVGINPYNGSSSANGFIVLNHAFCPSPTPGSGTAPTYDQTNCAETIGSVVNMKADANGSLWLADAGSTATTTTYVGTQNELVQISTSTGAFEGPGSTATQASVYPVTTSAAPESIAVDQLNNVWIGVNAFCTTCTGSTPNIYKYPFTTGTPGTLGTSVGAGQAKEAVYGLALDADQNVWGEAEYSSGYVGLISNTNATSTYNTTAGMLSPAPVYTTYTTTSNPDFTTPSGTSAIYGITIDGSGNAWVSSTKSGGYGMVVIQPTGLGTATPGMSQVGSLITGATASTTNGLINYAAGATNRYVTSDGDSAIWVGTYNSGSLARYYGTAGTSVLAFTPCYISGTTCATYSSTIGFSGTYYPTVDSTGAVWGVNQ